MFHKQLVAILAVSLACLAIAPTNVSAGGPNQFSISPSSFTVSVGENVGFTVSYSCSNTSWTSIGLQLFFGPDFANGTPLGSVLNLSAASDLPTPSDYNTVITRTLTTSFSTPGTYAVDVTAISNDQFSIGCDFSATGLPVSIQVVAVQTSITATTSTNIAVGDSVDFTLTYDCPHPWTYATAQLFNGTTMTSANKLGSLIRLDYPTGQNQTSVSTTKSITFNEVGTYTINASVFDAVYDNGTVPTDADNCEIANTETVTVTVRAVATTTTVASATSTTVAATTVSTTSLPKTGTDTNDALVALAVAIAGGAVILGRRRLVTK